MSNHWWMNKQMCYIPTMEYYSSVKRNEVQKYAITRWTLKAYNKWKTVTKDHVSGFIFMNEANHKKVLTNLFHQKELGIVTMYASRRCEEKSLIDGLLWENNKSLLVW